MVTLNEVLDEIQRQIDWRGPTGKPLGHVVVERSVMIQFVEALRSLPLMPPEFKVIEFRDKDDA